MLAPRFGSSPSSGRRTSWATAPRGAYGSSKAQSGRRRSRASTSAFASPGGRRRPAASNAGEERPEEATTTVLLAGDPLKRAAAAASREMADLQRTILRRLPGAVVVRGDEAPAAEPVLRISRAGGEVLLESTEGLEVEDARRRLEALLAPPGAPMPAAAAWSVAREALVTLEEGNCRCRAADWLRGYVGYRVLSGLRAGQRCLVRVAPVHAFGPEGLPDLDLPGDVELEYDLEVLQVISSEDVTAHLCWGREGVASKRTTRSGEGTSSPTEGCEARIRLRVTDGASGAELVAERELTLEVASGNVCAAVDEIVPTMKENEACEVHCADSSICADSTLGLELKDGAKVVFHLELLGFEKVDLQSLSASEKIAYSSKRKEVGTRFFQEGLQHPQQRAIWFRALKRYFQAAAVLGAAGSWPDEEKEAGLAQRRLCRLNTAACYLKLEAWQETARSCNLVLDEEPENTKALFRRGQALSELGDHSGAEQCAKAMLKSDPKSREAARLLAKAKQGLRADAEKRKGLMARMAQGIGDGGEAAAATGPPEAAGEGPAAGGPDGKGAGSREGPAATEEAQEPLAVSSPLWPWALAALAGTSLALVLAVRWHRQRGARP